MGETHLDRIVARREVLASQGRISELTFCFTELMRSDYIYYIFICSGVSATWVFR